MACSIGSSGAPELWLGVGGTECEGMITRRREIDEPVSKQSKRLDVRGESRKRACSPSQQSCFKRSDESLDAAKRYSVRRAGHKEKKDGSSAKRGQCSKRKPGIMPDTTTPVSHIFHTAWVRARVRPRRGVRA
jgi:hypothetical protein